jgi:hypothetical protein
MAQELFTNNAYATLAAPITNVATTLTVSAGRGALYPNPTGGQFFRFTLLDASLNAEIGFCTQRTGDVFNVIARGQEGTTARAYTTGDAVKHRWTAGAASQLVQIQNALTLTDAANIDWNTSVSRSAVVTLGGNRIFNAPTGLVSGESYVLVVKQDATGGRTIAWNGIFKWPLGAAPVLSTAANAIDILSFVVNGTNLYGMFQKGFA